jgi:glycosyltransferase involved in cell wall biosynthesis
LRDSDVPDADVIIATWWETAEWIQALSPRKGVKVHFVQGFEPHLYVPLERCEAVHRLPMRRIVVSRWLRDIIRERYGHEDMDIVPNSVDPGQFNAPVRGKQPVPTVGFVYAPGGIKGADAVVSAITRLRDKYRNLRVIAFGTVAPTRQAPLPAYIEMTVLPPQSGIKDLYSHCDAWISASRSEGFGLPVIEAMACRTPVVATRTGWPLEAIVSQKNGVLVDVDDVSAMAAGLDWILSLDDERWRALSRRAFETACAGSWDQSSKMFEQALVQAIDTGAAGQSADDRLPAARREEVTSAEQEADR